MRRVWTFGGGAATAATLGIIALAVSSGSTPASPPQDPPLPDPMPRALAAPIASRSIPRGAGSCAAQACHGSATEANFGNLNVLRNEHTTWITRDPHASAYDVLSSARSASIIKNLKGTSKAYEDSRCLACHATPSAALVPAVDREILLRDGVGCESCHGPSSDWASEHTRFDWAGMDSRSKEGFGFRDMKDLAQRAETCAGCHIGAPASGKIPARDVNHDLIAAGHPRLTFEFSAYMANYPAHWAPATQPIDKDARLWKVGQIASLKAAVELLHDRATVTQTSPKTAPWPELAEYACFSCHFALKDKDPKTQPFRGLRDPDERAELGIPIWNSWHLPMFKALVKGLPGGAPSDVTSSLSQLRDSMKTFETDPKLVAHDALATRDALENWLQKVKNAPVNPATIKQLQSVLNERNPEGRRAAVTSWDSAAQLYLAIAALHVTQQAIDRGAVNPTTKEDLAKMLEQLAFPNGFDSPQPDFNPNRLP